MRAASSAARMRRVASRPSSSGIRMSIRMTVGWKRAALATASSPLLASATTSMSGLPREQHAEPGAHHRLVVGDEDADAHRASRVSGRRVLSRKPPPLAVPALISPP